MEFFGEAPNGRETIGSFVSYYEPGWQNVQHGGMFREARRVLDDGRPLVGRVPCLLGGVDSPRSTSSESTGASTTARPSRLPGPAVPRAVHARLRPRACRAHRGRARRHRPGRLGQGLRRHVDGVDKVDKVDQDDEEALATAGLLHLRLGLPGRFLGGDLADVLEEDGSALRVLLAPFAMSLSMSSLLLLPSLIVNLRWLGHYARFKHRWRSRSRPQHAPRRSSRFAQVGHARWPDRAMSDRLPT